MANRVVHESVGAVAGAVLTMLRNDGRATLAEILLGAIGGYMGACAPDILEPPTCPNHRDVAHGIVTAACGGMAYLNALDRWQETLRGRASEIRYARQFLTDPKTRSNSEIVEVFLLLFAGILPGFFAGYASHLALDATTPRGLPLLTRSF